MSYDSISANFDVGLISPGDYVTYEVTVTNKGTLDAILVEDPIVNTGNNKAIIYGINGIENGEKLQKNNGTNTFTITITYKSSVSSQPSNTGNDITIQLNYKQDLSEEDSIVEGPYSGELYLDDYGLVGLMVDGEGYCIENNWGVTNNICFAKHTQCEDVISKYGSGYYCKLKDVTIEDIGLAKSSEKPFYIKYEVEEGNVLETYMCFVNDKEHCISPNDYEYEENTIFLDEVWFTDNGGSCVFDDMYNKRSIQYLWYSTLYDRVSDGLIRGTSCSDGNSSLHLYDDGNVSLVPGYDDTVLFFFIKDNGISGGSD